MRRLFLTGILGLLVPCAFGQLIDSDFHYYTYGNVSHSLLILGSSDVRTGGGFSLAVGRKDPKLRLLRHIEGELIWEGYYVETNTSHPTVEFPSTTSQAFGVLATARYRWQFRPEINFYGDIGMGIQFSNHNSADLRLNNNTTPTVGMGMEYRTSESQSVLVGTRVLHASNAGRTNPNPGQNLLQWYVGIRYKH
ncbi:MAG: acyloxyacyl hydrolase [Armatimonadota bacterium]